MYQFLVRHHSLYENITVYVGAITISKEFWKGIAVLGCKTISMGTLQILCVLYVLIGGMAVIIVFCNLLISS